MCFIHIVAEHWGAAAAAPVAQWLQQKAGLHHIPPSRPASPAECS